MFLSTKSGVSACRRRTLEAPPGGRLVAEEDLVALEPVAGEHLVEVDQVVVGLGARKAREVEFAGPQHAFGRASGHRLGEHVSVQFPDLVQEFHFLDTARRVRDSVAQVEPVDL